MSLNGKEKLSLPVYESYYNAHSNYDIIRIIMQIEKLNKNEKDLIKMKAEKLIGLRLKFYAKRMNLEYKRFCIKFQRTRWGSCSSERNLNFNGLLIFVPKEVLDYVVVHELCHLKQMNHSKEFWKEVENVMPDYEIYREWLKKEGYRFIKRL